MFLNLYEINFKCISKDSTNMKKTTQLKQLGEFGLIERLRSKLNTHSPRIKKGIGDDSAVFSTHPNTLQLTSTDALIETIHFDLKTISPYMLLVAKSKKPNIIPSAIHIDGTARPQFVEKSDNPSYYKILKAIKKITGYGVVINTSFNKHGRTIVNRPSDAIKDFLDSDMDYVFFENLLVSKK